MTQPSPFPSFRLPFPSIPFPSLRNRIPQIQPDPAVSSPNGVWCGAPAEIEFGELALNMTSWWQQF